MATQLEQTYLSYNPDTNTYDRVGYQEYVDRLSALPDVRPNTIGDVLIQGQGGSFGRNPSPALGTGVQGSLHDIAAGFSGVSTIMDVLQASSSPTAALLSGIEGFTNVKEGLTRAETLDRATTPNATVADMLAAYNAQPGWTDYALDALGVVTGALTGNVIGTVASGLNLASNIKAEVDAAEHLQSAAALEQQAAITGQPTFGGFGHVNTAANFQEQQAANLAAAQTDVEPTEFASITPSQDAFAQTVGGVLSQASSYNYTSVGTRSGNIFGDFSSAAEERSAYAEATRGSGFNDGNNEGGGSTGSSYSGSGGSGFGGSSDASETGADPGGSNVA